VETLAPLLDRKISMKYNKKGENDGKAGQRTVGVTRRNQVIIENGLFFHKKSQAFSAPSLCD
jgi:hypothetical protein